jgi:hypothetical protein
MYSSTRHRLFVARPSKFRRSRTLGILPVLAILAPGFLTAQTHPAPQTPAPVPAHAQKPTTLAPAALPAPDWPINAQPKPAAISWNKPDLRIDAANSSLQQILTDVAAATGASVEGLTKDERIFGDFGPAPARDVLAQLLQGTGYNIMLIGDQGKGVPRQIVLTARNTNKTPQGITRPMPEENDDDFAPEPQYDPPPQQPPQQLPQPMRPGFNPGMNPQQQAPQGQPQANPPN